MSLSIIAVPVGPLETNCYLVTSSTDRESIVIDPGYEAEGIYKLVLEKQLNVKEIVLTHGHFDHVTEAHCLSDLLGGVVVRLNFKDRDQFKFEGPLHDIEEGDIVKIGNDTLAILETPGHTEGSIILYSEGHLFSGDLLFAGGIGRTDLPGGSYAKLIASITGKVLVLPSNTSVYPGHGPFTTIGDEADSF